MICQIYCRFRNLYAIVDGFFLTLELEIVFHGVWKSVFLSFCHFLGISVIMGKKRSRDLEMSDDDLSFDNGLGDRITHVRLSLVC